MENVGPDPRPVARHSRAHCCTRDGHRRECAANRDRGSISFRKCFEHALAGFGSGAPDIALTTLQRYVHISPVPGGSLRGSYGLGRGTAELSDRDGAVEADLDSRTMAGGARVGLFRTGELRVAAQTADGVGTAAMPDVMAEANRARLALEGAWITFSSETVALGTKVEIAGRRDGGDAGEGCGVEVGGELSFRHPPTGLEITGRGRVLATHQASDYEEWGASDDPAHARSRCRDGQRRRPLGRRPAAAPAYVSP